MTTCPPACWADAAREEKNLMLGFLSRYTPSK